MQMDGQNLTVSVWRSSGGDNRNPADGHFQKFLVPANENQTILDVVSWIQQNQDASLSYRFACRVGMCGSCAMMINGKPRWTCRTHVNKVLDGNKITIAPLRNLPIIKDLVVNMDEFFDKWIAAEGVFHPTKTRKDPFAPILPDNPKRIEANRAVECINCAVCYAACDVVTASPDYLGPAALNRSWSLFNDQRDGEQTKRLDAASQSGGCHNCHSQQGCTTFCPNELNPTASIAGLKRETAKAFFGRGQ